MGTSHLNRQDEGPDQLIGPLVVLHLGLRPVGAVSCGRFHGRKRALGRRGLLHRLAHGFYGAVAPEHDPDLRRPTIEAAAAGIATAIYGDRVPVLTADERAWVGLSGTRPIFESALRRR
jgi:hypothetical protein